MAKNCAFNNTESATKAWFRTNGLIDSTLSIKNLPKFRQANRKFSVKAKKDYNVDGQLFFEEEGGKKAIPNSEMFRQIDYAKDYFENGDGIYKQKRKVKEGVDEIFASTPELASIGTKEQYSDYLATIFPDSKAKDILTVATQVVVDTVEGVKKLIRQKKDYRGGYIRVYKDFEGYGQTGKYESKDKKAVINVERKNVHKKDSFDENIAKEVLTKYGIPLEAVLDVGLINEARNELKKALKSPSKRVRESHTQFREVLNNHKKRAFKKHPSLNSTNINAILNDINAGMAEAGTDISREDYYKVRKEEDIVFLGTEKDIEGFKNYTSVYKQKKPNKNKQEIDIELEAKLKTFLSSHGISVEFVETLKERGYDAVAIADIANRLILVSKKEADFSTLPEEAAHIAIELLGSNNPMVKRLLDIIEETPIYTETYNEYKDDADYQLKNKKGELVGPNILKIKKEAIGKAISKQLTGTETNDRIKGVIGRIWNRIKSLFKKIDRNEFVTEVNQITGSIAKDIISNKLAGDTANLVNAGIYKQKTNKKKDEAIEKAEKSLEVLKTRLKKLQRKFTPEGDVSLIKDTIKDVKFAIMNKQAVAGIGYYVDTAAIEASSLMGIINAYRTNNDLEVLSSSVLRDINDFIVTHENTLSDLLGFFADDVNIQKTEEGRAVYEAAEEVYTTIAKIKLFYNRTKAKTAAAIIEKNTKSGNNVAEELLKMTDKDTSPIRRHLLSMGHASEEILNIVYDMFKKAKNAVERKVLSKGKELSNIHVELEQTGFKDFGKFYEKYTTGKKKGKKTGNVVSKYNNGEFYGEMEKTKKAITKALGAENYNEIDRQYLSDKDSFIYSEHWKDFYRENYNMETKSPSNKYLNPVFNTITGKQKEYYNKLLEIKEEATGMLPKGHQRSKFFMPQIRKDLLDRLKSKEQGIFSNIKELVKETGLRQEDDTEYGDSELTKAVPIHYNRKLDDMTNLTDDITSMYVAYYNMAANFESKIDLADDMLIVKEVLGERKYKKGEVQKEGIETNTYQMMDVFLDTHLYGKKKVAESPMSWRGKEIIIKGKPLYLSKILDSFNSYVRRNNLAFNPFTHTANAVMGTAYNNIEAVSGKYFSSKDKLWADKEIWKNLPAIVSQIGSKKKTNKVALLFEYNNISKSTTDVFKNMNTKNAFGRALFDSGVYSTYEVVDYKIKGKVMLSMYHSYKFIDGQFMTKKQLTNKLQNKEAVEAKWESTSTTLYDAYEAVNGVVKIKDKYKSAINIELEDTIKNTTNQINDQIDGKISDLDRSAFQRNVWGRLILTHRGWLLSGAEARYKDKGYNYSTGQMEEGYHKTFFNKVIKGLIANKGNFTAMAMSNLEDYEKENVRKAWADIIFIAASFMLANLLNNLADDEDKKDEWGYQFAAYMGTRVELEAGAFVNPREVLSILESPAAGINQVESIMDGLGMMFSYDDEGTWGPNVEVSRGTYKGYTKLEKLLIKRSMAKNFFELGDPRSKNTYLKQKIL